MIQYFFWLWLIPAGIGMIWLIYDIWSDASDTNVDNGTFWILMLMLLVPGWNICMLCYVAWHDLINSQRYVRLNNDFVEWQTKPLTIIQRKEKN